MRARAREWDADAWRERVRTSFAEGKVSRGTAERAGPTRYEKADVTNAEDRALIDSCPPRPPCILRCLLR